MSLEDIMRQVKQLSLAERKQLVELIADTLDEAKNEHSHSLSDFRGMASHLADEEDPQDFVNRMRNEWDAY